jgi:large-conductance mechanosensitive channel
LDWETGVVEDMVADAQTQTEAQVSELFSKFLKARRKKISWPQFQRFVLDYLLAAEASFLDTKKAIQKSTKTERPMLKDLLAEHKNRMTLIRRLGDAMA